ncbi:MAG: bifunctional 5,10-methylene-tetrahydrofolate dehydrogenase/5,10-methylene-tetrahydrofolate cyclohydrolase [Gemmatimonadetes bacterium]|nr:bifunctional 5,10-methylene-tetrahydrofolate dehydrogenase/5,10-methylene-tetrahydrofolate cyclohydrolase [Gemmatimonadota bacterium]
MSARILDGNAVGRAIREELRAEVAELGARGRVPGLSVVLVGENPASEVYVRMKGKAADELGMRAATIRLPVETAEAELLALLDRLNADAAVHGILVQLPLPKQMKTDTVLRRLRPEKDVDGFHPINVGKLVIGDRTAYRPCTPAGVQELLLRCGIDPRGQHVVIVGRSLIVGRPVANILLQDAPGANATVTVCHTKTQHLARFTRDADILIVAAGRPEVITGDMIRPGGVVVDVGVNRVDDPAAEKGYRLVGDVKFSEAAEVAGAITPVPGGVGPMTIAMLMKNTVQAARQAA